MIEPSSPLAPYYPNDFDSDPNGKRQPWEAVVKIPFIDGDKLLDVVNGILESDEEGINGELLTNAERRRNVRGVSHTFVPKRDGGGETVLSLDVNGSAKAVRKPAAARKQVKR
jgi:5'-3' exonuclease